MCRARAEFSGHGLSQLGAGPVVVVTSGTTRGDGLLFCLLPLMPKSCPRIGIFSSQYFPRTQTLLFPAHYLNFSGGWRLIDAAISFYPPSVKSKLPSQR